MPPAAANSPDRPFQRYLDLAINEGATLAARAVTEAFRTLAKASAEVQDPKERNRQALAAEALNRQAQTAAESFPALLRQEIEAARRESAAPAKALSFESLELMAEDQVDDTVELLRGQQAVVSAVETELVALNALVSAAQGHEKVTTSSNPLRPEVWMRALHKALGRGSAADRASWMLHIGQALGPELAALYRRLAEAMQRDGVAAATYKITSQLDARRRIMGDSTGPTLRDLKRLLANVARGGNSTQGLTRPAGDTMNGMTMPAAMEALQGMKRMDDVVRRMQDRWRKGEWQAEAGAPGAAAEYTPTQTLAREVARLMISNVAADERLLPDVQEAVRQLEPALLKLVLNDQRFFVDRQHPARQLLEEMTQRSLAWPQRNTPGFIEFFSPLRDAVEMLAKMPVEDEEPFHFAIQMLRQSWDEAEERTRRQRASMARTLIKADARNHAAAEIAAQLAGRADLASVPLDVRRFLLGPWCQVMAASRLAAAPGEMDPGGYGALVNDIVWSSQPQLTAQDPARLKRLAPSLMQAVQTALAGIGITQERAAEMLQGLAGAHAGKATTAAPAADGIAWDDSRAWLTPDELGKSGLVETMEDSSLADFQPTQLESRGAPLEPHPSVAAGLKSGQYVEVQVRGNWTRWRMTWASPHGLMLMFVDGRGRPQSMTRQTLDKMLDIGAMRLLASGSVVDGALDMVAQAALENSTHVAGG